MKKLNYLLMGLLFIGLCFSCDDDNDDDTVNDNGNETPEITCKILSINMMRGEDTRYESYVYDTVTGNVVKVNYSETSTSEVDHYELITYTDNKFNTIKEYSSDGNTVYSTKTFTYTGDNITKIVEEGTEWDDENNQEVPYTTTAMFTYEGDLVSSITVTGDRENMTFKNLTYESGNLKKVEVDMSGNGDWVEMEVKLYDDKKSIYKSLIPDWDAILFGSSANNMMIMVSNTEMDMGDGILHVGDTLFNQTYTYNTYDEVLTLTSYPTIFEDKLSVQTFTWECK